MVPFRKQTLSDFHPHGLIGIDYGTCSFSSDYRVLSPAEIDILEKGMLVQKPVENIPSNSVSHYVPDLYCYSHHFSLSKKKLIEYRLKFKESTKNGLKKYNCPACRLGLPKS